MPRIRLQTIEYKSHQFDVISLTSGAKDSVMVLGLVKGKILFVNKFDVTKKTTTLSLPGGVVDANESLIQAAQRELTEEAGYTFNEQDAQIMGTLEILPGYIDVQTHCVFCPQLSLAVKKGGDEVEEMENTLLSWAQVKQKIKSGLISDSRTVAFVLMGQLIDKEK